MSNKRGTKCRIKRRKACAVNQKYGVLLGSEATVVDGVSRVSHTKKNKEIKIYYAAKTKSESMKMPGYAVFSLTRFYLSCVYISSFILYLS